MKLERKYSVEDYRNWPTLDEPLRYDSTGVAATQSLFFETIAHQTKDNHGLRYTSFTLNDIEREVRGDDGRPVILPSAYQIIHYCDSEYEAAMKICGSWDVWKRIRNNKNIDQGLNGQHYGIADALAAQDKRIEADMMKGLVEQAAKGNVSAQKELRALKARAEKVNKALKPKKDNTSHLAEWKKKKQNG